MSPATIFGLQSPVIRAQPQVASAEFRHSVDLSSFNIALHETEAFPAMRGQLVSPESASTHVHICVQQRSQSVTYDPYDLLSDRKTRNSRDNTVSVKA